MAPPSRVSREAVLVAGVVLSLCCVCVLGALPFRSERDLARASDAVFVGRVMHVVKREVVKSDTAAADKGSSDTGGDGGDDTTGAVVVDSKWSDYVYEVYANVRSQVRHRAALIVTPAAACVPGSSLVCARERVPGFHAHTWPGLHSARHARSTGTYCGCSRWPVGMAC